MERTNLFFLCGPHGAGKTTLGERLQKLNSDILMPELKTSTPKFHTDPLERMVMKFCQRAIENFEAAEIAGKYPDRIILANRCIYDCQAYAQAYLSLGWISQQDYKRLMDLAQFTFPEKVRSPKAIVLNTPFEVICGRLENRWRSEGKKWQEENLDYLKAACDAYKPFKSNPNIIYAEDNGDVERINSQLDSYLAKLTFA